MKKISEWGCPSAATLTRAASVLKRIRAVKVDFSRYR